MRDVSLWRCPLGVDKAVIERVEFVEDAEVVVAHVPWARDGAGHTRAFDDQVAWSATWAWRPCVRRRLRAMRGARTRGVPHWGTRMRGGSHGNES